MEDGGAALLQQLDRILSSDHLIDEVGYVHPSQLAILHEGSTNVDEAIADPSVFWCADHKLAISTEALGPLYTSAKSAFIMSRKAYQCLLLKSSNHMHVLDPANSKDLQSLTKELFSHTRAMVLLNPGCKTAWDVRKQIFVALSIVYPVEELQLSSLALSLNPKCEEAWAHRRWTIRGRVESLFSCQIPEHLLQEEFKLVATIADRSRMNYRAWRHCCWLVQWMSIFQVFQELERWKRWAELHVAESSCFHFRRCLFQKLLTDDRYIMEVKDAWLGETHWNKDLIKRYIGREALWLHQRFLFSMWVQHLKQAGTCSTLSTPVESVDECPCPEVEAEITFADSCIASCINDDTEDGVKQIVCATAFKLWVILQECKDSSLTSLIPSPWQTKELHNIEQVLGSKAAYQKDLWEGLFERFSV